MTEHGTARTAGTGGSTEIGYFTSMYAHDDDPWGFDDNWYERRKYDVTMAALPRSGYSVGLEPGCSNGALTERLAGRCERLYSFDFVEQVAERARHRLRCHEHVHVLQATFPHYWPATEVDLVVWSEVAYYLDDVDADHALTGLRRWLAPGGDLVCVHYTGDTNYPRSGDAIGPWIDRVPWLSRLVHHDDENFTLGVWRRAAHPA